MTKNNILNPPSFVDFFRKLNEGFRQSKNGQKDLPSYAQKSVQMLMTQWIEHIQSNDDPAVLEIVLDSLDGPLAQDPLTNDQTMLQLFQKMKVDPWSLKLPSLTSQSLLEYVIEQNWTHTLKWMLTHPNRPQKWDSIPLFKHHVPLIHVAAMRKIEILKIVLQAGANPGLKHNKTSILKRAGSHEHFSLLIQDSRTHDSLKEYVEHMSQERISNEFKNKLKIIIDVIQQQQISNIHQIFKPVLEKIINNFPAGLSIWNILSELKSPHLPSDWLQFPTLPQTSLFKEYSKWPILAGMAHRQFFKIKTESTSINHAYLKAILNHSLDWGQLTPGTKIPLGVWPALLILAFPDGLNAYAENLRHPTSLNNLTKKNDIQDFIPFLGNNPTLFWKSLLNTLNSKQIEKNNHWAKGQVLNQLLSEPLFENLPHYQQNKEELKNMFLDWFSNPLSEKISNEKCWPKYNQTYMLILVDNLKQGSFNLEEEYAIFWSKMIQTGALKPHSVIALLKAHSDSGNQIQWNETWETFYDILDKKTSKGKNLLQLKPELERWKLRNNLANPIQTSSRKIRI